MTSDYTTDISKDNEMIDFLINKKMNSIMGEWRHIAVFVPNLMNAIRLVKQVGKSQIAIGINSDKSLYGNQYIKTHAEIAALQKLENMIKNKKIKKLHMDLIVIRINQSGELRESGPCYHCTNKLRKNKNIKLNKLYYSRHDGSVSCIKFSDWFKRDNIHVSKGWRRIIKKVT